MTEAEILELARCERLAGIAAGHGEYLSPPALIDAATARAELKAYMAFQAWRQAEALAVIAKVFTETDQFGATGWEAISCAIERGIRGAS